MAKEENVLLAQIAALHRKHGTCARAVKQSRSAISRSSIRQVSQGHQPYKNRLEELKKRVEGECIDPGPVKEAWSDCLSIKQKAQQVFNQCLDYIGGIAIASGKLEENIVTWRKVWSGKL